ncbi:MAG: hypothetical protein ACM32I_08665 [Nitrospirota bacterium]
MPYPELKQEGNTVRAKIERGSAMSLDRGLKRLKFALMLFIVFNLFYGVSFLFFTSTLVSMSGSPEPLNLSWIRWAGGPLLALGIGAIPVFRDPSKQGTFVTAAAMSSLFGGLGLLYSKIFDHSTSYTWFHMTPSVLALLLFVLLFWARQGAKDILK